MMTDNMSAFAEEVLQERGYLSRAAKFLFLWQTLVTYLFQSHFYNGSIGVNVDSVKKSFNILTLSHPPPAPPPNKTIT